MPVRTADIQLSIGFAAGGDNPFGSKATTPAKEMSSRNSQATRTTQTLTLPCPAPHPTS